MSLRLFTPIAIALLSLTGCGSHLRVMELVPGLEPMVARADVPAPTAGEPILVPAGMKGTRPTAAPDGPYLLDTGDRLRIFVYGQPNLSRLYTVDHSGMITFPLVGNVRARGTTTSALEKSIAARLSTEYVKDPHVTVDVQQNRPFFILGEVRNAGQYPFVSGMTVEAAVAIAGGFGERASEERFRITRRAQGLVEVLEVPGDFLVQPGDTVYVHERFF